MNDSQLTELLTERVDFTGIVGRVQKVATPLTSPEGGIRVVLANCRRGDWEHAAQYFQGGITAYRVVPAIVTEILGRISSQGTADDFTVESEEYGTDGVTLRIRTTAEGQPLGTWTWVFDRRNIGWTIREVV